MGDFPIMTENGTFIINGAERVIVSQIVRSPGMYYDSMLDKTGKRIYTAQVIPYRGAWIEYETDMNDVMYVRIDKNRKMPLTIFIRALGFDTEQEIIDLIGDDHYLRETLAKDDMESEAQKYSTSASDEALKDIYKRLRPGDPPLVESAQLLINNMFFDPKRYDLMPVGRYKYDKKMDLEDRLRGQVLARPCISLVTGEVIGSEGDIIDDAMLEKLRAGAVNEAYISASDGSELKLLSNGMVYPEAILGYDLTDIGIKHKVRYSVLSDIINEVGTDEEDLKCEAKNGSLNCRRNI